MGSFFCVVFADVFAEVVVLVALGTVADGLFHAFFDAVKIVEQALLIGIAGIRVLLDDVDDVLDFLTTLPDGIIQRLPLPRLLNLAVARNE